MLKINKGKVPRARRVLIYGENGIGKSTLAAQFPKPIFLNLEDGIGDLDCDSTEVIRSVKDFQECLIHLVESDYQTIVVDTVDWLEKLIFSDVADRAGKKTIDDIGFGKGYQAVDLEWKGLCDGCGYLWKQGRHIVLTCHETIEKFTNPEGDSYNYWRPALHIKGSGRITEWCDEVFFLKYRTNTVTKDEGFGNKRAVAIGGKERFMCCTKAASHEAKNRLGMPDEVAPVFASIAEYLPPIEFKPKSNGNIAGVVKDGSSKPQLVTSAVTEETPF